MTDTKSLLDEIEAIIAYNSGLWPLRCSLSSTHIQRIAEIVKQLKHSATLNTIYTLHDLNDEIDAIIKE